MQFYLRKHTKEIAITISGFFLVLLFVTSGSNNSNNLRYDSVTNKHWGGAYKAGAFPIADSIITKSSNSDKQLYKFAIITDLDKLSKVDDKHYKTILQPGTLVHENNQYTMRFDETIELTTSHNEAGRGAEFSELTVYQDRLLTFDDRSGKVFEIIQHNHDGKMGLVPRFVITEGDGETDKGMKWEWATVKDNELYMGSMGKEYTNSKGETVNEHNLWITVIDENGSIRRENWKQNYNKVRAALGADAPGYMVMEAILWSDFHNAWIFLPRRISTDPYDEVVDEHRGGRKLILVKPDFSSIIDVREINMVHDDLRGFSTFAFVPNTKDQHILAVRSVEENCTGKPSDCKQRSYVLVFDINGKVISDKEYELADMKYEGIEFVNLLG